MKKEERWQVAQDYEKGYWRKIAKKIISDSKQQLTWYDWKAKDFEKRLDSALKVNKEECKILEVGSGPIGMASYIKWGERYALDPLNQFYLENPQLVAVRDENVNYITGSGEKIPFPDRNFNVVIIDNVLDHVQEPDAVANELFRVLDNDGILYIELNIHTVWGCILHTVLAKLSIDKGHPYSFTASRIRKFLVRHGFEIKKEDINDYFEARVSDRKSPEIKSKIKGYSGLSEFIFHAVCTKL